LRPALNTIHSGAATCERADQRGGDQNPDSPHIDRTCQMRDWFRARVPFATVVTYVRDYGLCGLM